MNDIAQDFIARITLFPTDKGGRTGPIVSGRFGCPCKFDEKDFSGWDVHFYNEGAPFLPGDTRAFGAKFLSPEIAPAFRMV